MFHPRIDQRFQGESSTNADSQPAPTISASWWSRVVWVRLRFVLILLIASTVVSSWESLTNQWDRVIRLAIGRASSSAQPPVSSDTEYFCPMDPGILSDWPGKCGVCNMALVRRKRGDLGPLPSGVLARMQLTPYRVQLAGIRTSPVAYLALELVIPIEAEVVRDSGANQLLATVSNRWASMLGVGVALEVPERPSITARVSAILRGPNAIGGDAQVRVELVNPSSVLRVGERWEFVARRQVADLEPFVGLPADAPALTAGEPALAFLCPEHPEVLSVASGKCPLDGRIPLVEQPLLANQRIRWWCPMHPRVVAEKPGATCGECGGMKLVPRVVTYRPRGQVLAIPESAVVDTGTRTVVWLERMPDLFESVEVQLGPRCGDIYPVVSGLEPGQAVVTVGAFLLDAETRLNPRLAAAYFGANRFSRGGSSAAASTSSSSAPRIPPRLRELAEKQKICPVTRKPLGSMGAPIPIKVAGRNLLLCCEGCESAMRADPAKYFARLDGTDSAP